MTDLLERLGHALAKQYVIERELGRGGMATVFLARDLKHGRSVAVKVLHPQLAAALGPDRFLREIRLTARLTHPHILPLHDSGEVVVGCESQDEVAGHKTQVVHDDAAETERPTTYDSQPTTYLYYVMPYVEGESLRQRLDRERQLPLDDALLIARNVAAALDYAHARGVIHRDIKPENILLEAGEAVAADFGVARAIEVAGTARLTETGVSVGTPAYMSPEQAFGEAQLDGRADIYALACVLYEMLAGDVPFAAPTAQAILARRLTETPRPIRQLRDTVPEAVERALEKALARLPADRFGTAGEFAAALTQAGANGPVATPPQPGPAITAMAGRRHLRPALVGLAVAAAVLAGGTALLLRRSDPAPPLDASLVAVAPFDVLDPRLEFWREGVMDLLSRGLDGAGPLRTVSPTVVVRRWEGRAEPASAVELGRRTGAGLVVYGAVTWAGGDSVRLRAALLDARSGRGAHEVEVVDQAGRIDRVTDSLVFRLLRDLGRTRPIGAWRRVGYGTTSLPALKAFLQGEQLLRRPAWDSALSAYERAIAADSTFALALRRAGYIVGWVRTGYDTLGNTYTMRAAAFNHGLPPRDSLLLTADSLLAALLQAGPLARGAGVDWWPQLQRLSALLQVAGQRYPDDPEIWHLTGEVHAHVGPWIGASMMDVLSAFDRAVALDSAFGPSYIHLIEYGPFAGDAAFRRYLRSYLALASAEQYATGAGIALRLLDGGSTAWSTVRFDSMPSELLIKLSTLLAAWPDADEARVQVARALSHRPPPVAGAPVPGDHVSFFRMQLALSLAARGHVREAGELVAPEWPIGFVELALIGAVPPARATPALREMVTGAPPEVAAWTLRWWMLQRDTPMLRAAVERGRALARAGPGTVQQQRGRYLVEASAAYASLVRGDSAEALERFIALPDSLCPACYFERLTRAELAATQNRTAEAAALLRADLPPATLTPFPSQQLWMLLRARVAERLGDRRTAVENYAWLARMWSHPDPDFQRLAAEAREGLSRLTAER